MGFRAGAQRTSRLTQKIKKTEKFKKRMRRHKARRAIAIKQIESGKRTRPLVGALADT